MDLDRSVNKVLRDLIQGEFVGEDDEGIVRLHLNRLATAAWEIGTAEINQHGNKPIDMYDQKDNYVNTFKSRKEASVKMHLSEKGIYNSMQTGIPIKRWIFRYKKATL
jgi:hypothetical protein